MRGPKAASPRLEPEAAPAQRPSRLVREEPARETARPAESLARDRSESLASFSSAENGAEDVPAQFAPIKDRAETEQMKVAASPPSALDDYGAAQE
jgi:hypothetical protein